MHRKNFRISSTKFKKIGGGYEENENLDITSSRVILYVKHHINEFKHWRIVVICYTFILFILNFIRCFDANFWADECFSIKLSKMTFMEMIEATANDVHPPLHYILLQIICKIMGHNALAYHFAGLLPYGILLVFTLTAIYNKFGKETAIIMVSFASLLPVATCYNVEIRMYSLSALFVLLSFYSLFNIFTENRIRDYTGFVLFSLGAAYSHYYALISVAFFYISMLLMGLFKRKEYLKNALISSIITVIAYLPWFFILLKTFQRTSDGYWMTEIPLFAGCFLYIFSNQYSPVFILYFLVFFIAVLAFILYETGILKIYNSKKNKSSFSINLKNFKISKRIIWMATGCLGFLGTVIVGIGISKIIRPMFTYRYIYPSATTIWLIISICISNLKGKRIYTALVLLLLWTTCIPIYKDTYTSERLENKTLNLTLDKTSKIIEPSDVLLTNGGLLGWIVLEHYYVGIPNQLIDISNFPVLDKNKHYWLFLDNEIDVAIISALKEQGYQYKNIISNGVLGTDTIYVYELVSI